MPISEELIEPAENRVPVLLGAVRIDVIAIPMNSCFRDHGQSATNVTWEAGATLVHFSVANDLALPYSRFLVELQSASMIGLDNHYCYTPMEAAALLAMALSLANEQVIFSPTIFKYASSVVENHPQMGGGQAQHANQNNLLVLHIEEPVAVADELVVNATEQLTISEDIMLNRLDRLVRSRFFQRRRATIPNNVTEGLTSYLEAIRAGTATACYLNLFATIEKMLKLQAQQLDEFLNREFGIPIDEVSRLRSCNNRFKHPPNSPVQHEAWKNCRETIRQRLSVLLTATNRAVNHCLPQ
ncbi:MAG: hypothetical protein AB7W16_21395 [Candidatus Obscuribacterales bacterium]